MGVEQVVFKNNQAPQCEDKHLNAFVQEINNAVKVSGLNISDTDFAQLASSILIMSLSGSVFDASGTPNSIVLTTKASKQAPSQYYDGMRIMFSASQQNTGSVNVNVSGLGVKAIKNLDGSDLSPGVMFGLVEIVYSEQSGYFIFNAALTAGSIATTAEAKAGTAGKILDAAGGLAAINQFGIGAGAPTISNANSQLTGRINTLVTPWTNGPISTNGALLCFGESDAVNLQIYAAHGSGQVYWRFRTGSAGTTSWRKVWDDRNNGSISDALAGTAGVYADCAVLKNLLSQTTVGGSNQAWGDYTASRSSGVVYTNTTNSPIEVLMTANQDAVTGEIFVDGIKIAGFGDSAGDIATMSFVVPVGSTYQINFATSGSTIWSELR